MRIRKWVFLLLVTVTVTSGVNTEFSAVSLTCDEPAAEAPGSDKVGR